MNSLLAEIGAALNIGCFRTAALLLKGDREAHERRRMTNEPACSEVAAADARTVSAAISQWRPWESADRFAPHLVCFDDRPTTLPIELLLLEQCALGCHLLGAAQVAQLAEQHAQALALIDKAPAAQQEAFIANKSSWLLQEIEHEALIDIRRLCASYSGCIAAPARPDCAANVERGV